MVAKYSQCKKKKYTLKRKRDQRGAGIIMAALVAASLTVVSVMATLIVLDIGYSEIFAEKLHRVNLWANYYASAHADDANVEAETQNYVITMMKMMNIEPIAVKTTVSQTGGHVQAVVTNSFYIRGVQGLLPELVTLRDSQSAPVESN